MKYPRTFSKTSGIEDNYFHDNGGLFISFDLKARAIGEHAIVSTNVKH